MTLTEIPAFDLGVGALGVPLDAKIREGVRINVHDEVEQKTPEIISRICGGYEDLRRDTSSEYGLCLVLAPKLGKVTLDAIDNTVRGAIGDLAFDKLEFSEQRSGIDIAIANGSVGTREVRVSRLFGHILMTDLTARLGYVYSLHSH